MPERLTIQTFVDGEWCDALLLSVDSIARVAESTCTVHYEHHYLINHLDEMGSVFAPAVSKGRRLRLAPIYDLAPMVLDPEGVTRVTKWETERAGAPDWQGVCAGLADLTDPAALWAQLLKIAEMFRALPGLLQDLPEEISAAQSIPLNNLDERLAQWGLR